MHVARATCRVLRARVVRATCITSDQNPNIGILPLDLCGYWTLDNVEIHMQFVVKEMKGSIREMQKLICQRMLTAIQEYMHPAYEAGERISSEKDIYKKLKDTIETQVREHMLRNLVTRTKDDLNSSSRSR